MRFEIHGVGLVRFLNDGPKNIKIFHLSMASIYGGRLKGQELPPRLL